MISFRNSTRHQTESSENEATSQRQVLCSSGSWCLLVSNCSDNNSTTNILDHPRSLVNKWTWSWGSKDQLRVIELHVSRNSGKTRSLQNRESIELLVLLQLVQIYFFFSSPWISQTRAMKNVDGHKFGLDSCASCTFWWIKYTMFPHCTEKWHILVFIFSIDRDESLKMKTE